MNRRDNTLQLSIAWKMSLPTAIERTHQHHDVTNNIDNKQLETADLVRR